MRKTFRYRIYPTKKQEKTLDATIEECRELYNAGLEERISAYKIAHKSISFYEQQNQLPAIKKELGTLQGIHSQVAQDALRRLDKGFVAFFERSLRAQSRLFRAESSEYEPKVQVGER